MSDRGFKELTVPVLAHGIPMRATVKFPLGDWQDYDIDSLYVEDSDHDIMMLVDYAGWLDPVEEQIAEYMLQGQWRYAG